MNPTLPELIKNLTPILNEGKYVFISLKNDREFKENFIMQFAEREGRTFILEQSVADELEFAYDFVASWITLEVNSSLHAVGLTAAFSKALADEGISSNVVAGYFHDHIFVNQKDSEMAMKVLKNLSGS